MTASDGLDEQFMALALDLGASVRRWTSPNPWVGAVVVAGGAVVGRGATEPPGGRHAEIVALDDAGTSAKGATLYVTLEPCAHEGRTGPCAEAVLRAGIARVVVALADPDARVAGRGLARLSEAGVKLVLGVGGDAAERQLDAYLTQRRTGRPLVVVKLAMTLDGRIAAPDGTSRWLTGEVARRDVHELRAECDAILVGAATVRADDPSLTVRLEGEQRSDKNQPLRVVLGAIPKGAAVRPALAMSGELGAVLDELGRIGILQLLVEGGAHVAHDFHAAGLVDRYVLYLAPALFGGDDARPAFSGSGAPTLEQLVRGSLLDVARVGEDMRVDLEPNDRSRRREPMCGGDAVPN